MGLYGLKHLIEKVTAVASTTQCPPHCKDQQSLRSRIDILISVFISSRLHLLPKHFEQAFFYVIFFTHIHLMICSSSMVNRIAVTTLLLTSSLHRC